MDSQLKAARRARKGIDIVRRHLLKPAPDALQACSMPLQDAIGCLESLEGELRASGHGGSNAHLLRNEILSLRRELLTVTTLLKAAGAFYQGYGGLLGNSPEPEEVQYGSQRSHVPEPDRRFVVHG